MDQTITKCFVRTAKIQNHIQCCRSTHAFASDRSSFHGLPCISQSALRIDRHLISLKENVSTNSCEYEEGSFEGFGWGAVVSQLDAGVEGLGRRERREPVSAAPILMFCFCSGGRGCVDARDGSVGAEFAASESSFRSLGGFCEGLRVLGARNRAPLRSCEQQGMAMKALWFR